MKELQQEVARLRQEAADLRLSLLDKAHVCGWWCQVEAYGFIVNEHAQDDRL